MANLDINQSEFERIYPTENDICFTPYNGVNGSEVNYSKNLNWRRPRNAILANLDGSGNPTALAGFVCSDGGGAVVEITRGRAYIEGRYVELNAGADFAVTVDADKDTYIYLKLNIAGSVQVTPPARFITVGVAHGAVHSREANAVLIAKVVTNATPTIDAIFDLRPSQMSDSVYLGDLRNPVAVPGTTPPGGNFVYLGSVDMGEILFNKTLTMWFRDTTGGPSIGGNVPIKVRAYGETTSYYENTYINNMLINNSLVSRDIYFGYVNIFNTGAGVKIPVGFQNNIYNIYAEIGATILFANGMSRIKEWAAIG